VLYVSNPRADSSEPPKNFRFDMVYGLDSIQEQIYGEAAYPIVASVLEGYNGTIFAYGQTGTGKTFTMVGEAAEHRGITPRAFEQIFYGVEQHPTAQFLIRVAFLEIYNEEIHDLLSKDRNNKLDLKENPDTGVYVKDLNTFVVKSIEEMQRTMIAGLKNRHTGETNMNRDSSRSHSIFIVTVETSETDSAGIAHYRVGKLNLVDLAGSERQSKTGATGDRFKEATNINKSLLILGNVISSLVDGVSSHIPYRDSKLTRLLQESLGGNSKTVMMANVGPADYNYDETISTLRYANRAKQIKCKPKINEDPKDALLREFQDEISRLKTQLELQGGSLTSEQFSKGGMILSGEPQVVEHRVLVQDEEMVRAMEARIEKEKQDIQHKAEIELKRISEAANIAEDEKQKLLQQLQERAEEEQKAKDNQQKLLRKLKTMENKLVKGSQIMETAIRQEQELQRATMELEMRSRQEELLQRELREKREEALNIEQKFSSQQDEIEAKNQKLKKLWTKYKLAESEVRDLQQEFAREREDLVDTIRELTRTLKLKTLVIDSFIPEQEFLTLANMVHMTEDSDDYVLPKLELSGNRIKRTGRLDEGGDNYDDFAAKKVQSAVQMLNEGENPESQPSVYFVYSEEGALREEANVKQQRKQRLKSAKRPVTASRKSKRTSTGHEEAAPAVELYPKARGLVSRGGT
jgi:kinesin family protein 3/17